MSATTATTPAHPEILGARLVGSLVSPIIKFRKDLALPSGLIIKLSQENGRPVVANDMHVLGEVSLGLSKALNGKALPSNVDYVIQLVLGWHGPRAKVTFQMANSNTEAIQNAQADLYNFFKSFRSNNDDQSLDSIGEQKHLEKVTRLFAFLDRPDLTSSDITCGRLCRHMLALKQDCIAKKWPVRRLCTLLEDDHTIRYGKRICGEREVGGESESATEYRRAASILGGFVTYCHTCHLLKTRDHNETTPQTPEEEDDDCKLIAENLSVVSGNTNEVHVNIDVPNLMYKHSLEEFHCYWFEWFPHFFDCYGEWRPDIYGYFGSLLAVSCADSVPFQELFWGKIDYNENYWRDLAASSSRNSKKRGREATHDSAGCGHTSLLYLMQCDMRLVTSNVRFSLSLRAHALP